MDNIDIALSLYMIYLLWLSYKVILSYGWEETTGTLLRDDISVAGVMRYTAEYNYQIDGNKTYNSKNTIYGLSFSFIYLVDSYIDKQNLKVFYNPINPEDSVLVKGFRIFHIIDLSLILSWFIWMYW